MSTSVEDVKNRLHERGAEDVKFFFNADLQSRLPSEVKEEAAELLDSYLKGETNPLVPTGKLTRIKK